MSTEEQAIQLIVHAGDAKSKAMKSIAAAKKGDFEAARQLLKESDSSMTNAHKIQTSILQDSFDNPEAGAFMLLAHGQDHLMNAITIQTLANEFITLYERVEALSKIVKGE